MNFPYRAPFDFRVLIDWVVTNKPAYVGMNDSQYAFFANFLVKSNKREVNGVPIRFLDGPKA